jgi:RimJ/RimL family protein N-acetyltransferase
VLQGAHVRLEPLTQAHALALAREAAAADPEFYRWTFVPRDMDAACAYVERALAWKRAGNALPFAIVRVADGQGVGSTRVWNLERWDWPEGHPRRGRAAPDACEIGYTWLSPSAARTAVNTEAKLLLLTHAFDTWQVLRVCLHADARNQRSRDAIERIGGRFEGILRSHRLAADFTARDSARYSILAAEWPVVKSGLERKLAQPRAAAAPSPAPAAG